MDVGTPPIHPAARVLAFYLPQFHPIPENDEWWGPGFTEWTNVAKAKPLFRGHVQPRLPADLGFYDLRVPETRAAQAELARAAGVEGFCYWHYWFGDGRRLLERPFAEVLRSGEPDFPFALAWANQTWSGIWHGNPGQTLIKQTYPGRADEAAHFDLVRSAFEDPRYIKVDGKPLFAIFSPIDLPDAASFIDHWRELAHRAGFPGLYFLAIMDRHTSQQAFYNELYAPFDALTTHPPHEYTQKLTLSAKLRRRIKQRNYGWLFRQLTGDRFKLPERFEFRELVDHALEDMPDELRFLPTVLSGWDNTPRSGVRGVVFEHPTPELFARYLRKALDIVDGRPAEHRIVLLKSWNEWAEGNYVEPDAQHGHAYLTVLREALLAGATT